MLQLEVLISELQGKQHTTTEQGARNTTGHQLQACPVADADMHNGKVQATNDVAWTPVPCLTSLLWTRHIGFVPAIVELACRQWASC